MADVTKTDVLFHNEFGLGLRPEVGVDGTYSRAGAGYYNAHDRKIRKLSAKQPRFSWVEKAGVLRRQPSLLLEASRTNSLTRSEEFDHADWDATAGTNGVTVTADDAVAPDGSSTADKLTPGGASSDRVEQGVTVADDSLNRTGSVYLKKGGSTAVRVSLEYTGGGTPLFNRGVVIDTTDGSVVSASGSLTDSFVEEVGDWWRVSVVQANNGTGNTGLTLQVRPDNNDGDDAVHVWGAQLEGVSGGASFPSSYIPTTSSTVTRSADSLSFPFSAAPQEMTVYGKLSVNGLPESGGSHATIFLGTSVGGGDAWLGVFVAPNGDVQVQFDDGSTFRSTGAAAGVGIGDVLEYTAVLNADGSASVTASVNGGAEVSSGSTATTALPSAWSSDTLWVNERNGLTIGFNDFIALKIAKGVRTMDEMRNFRVLPNNIFVNT